MQLETSRKAASVQNGRVIRLVRKTVPWLVVMDLAMTLIFWGATRLADQTRSVSGGLGVVFYTDNPSEALARIDKGIALLQQGKLDRLIMVGGHRPQEGRLGSQEMALAAARKSGLSGQISADVESRDTISGLERLATNGGQLESGKIVFISNCMHLLRAKAIYSSHPDKQPKALGACPGGGYNPLSIWRRAHYEAGAWALFVMPASWRDAIIDRLRGADE